eukprot:TRINITY_DN2900_c0_g1_i1.p1 TRINITY_DN2900_c0_g1~~TRINITY_DN2900_c0_g1_i1.p1  ORF type:complete len:285 (+),score=66.65 TRINITY_DN2900_c0_g1_i1:123-857(+)
MKNPAPVPSIGVISANPARSLLIAQSYLDFYVNHTNFRGFQVYTGEYQQVPVFVANTGLGGPACAFLVEELIAHGANVIIRLGTNDYNITEEDLDNVYVLQSVQNVFGLMRDYGYPLEQLGAPIPTDPLLVKLLMDSAARTPNVTGVLSRGYNVDGFYAFFDPTNVALNPAVTRQYTTQFQEDGCNVRDMESGALAMLGQVRGIRTAAVLQAVIKFGHHHEDVGTTGIRVVLNALYDYHHNHMQ